MTRFDIGPISFVVSPVTIMKGWLTANWIIDLDAEKEEIEGLGEFVSHFSRILNKRDDETELEAFCRFTRLDLDRTMEALSHHPRSVQQARRAVQEIVTDRPSRSRAYHHAREARLWMEAWLASPYHDLALHALALLATWGVAPLRPAVAVSHTIKRNTFGWYARALRLPVVHLSKIYEAPFAQLEFLETLLHEEMHAVVHHAMGNDGERQELPWLDELSALLTSQYAIACALLQGRYGCRTRDIGRALEQQRSEQRYGRLANAVMAQTRHPLLAWQAWQHIFRLPPAQKRLYANDSVITPLLRQLGWNVSFPFFYEAEQYVTVLEG